MMRKYFILIFFIVGLSIRDELVAQLHELGVCLVGDAPLGGVEEPEEGPNFCHVVAHAFEFVQCAVTLALDVGKIIHVFSIVGFYY